MEKERIGFQMERESSLAIEADAARWVARADHGPLSPRDQARLDEWLAGDARRLGAYARLSALYWRTERGRVLAEDAGGWIGVQDIQGSTGSRRSHEASRQGMDRRRLLAGGGAAAAVGVLLGGVLWAGSGSRAYATTVGEVRRIPLSDMVTATLNTDTELVAKRDGRIDLKRGEALFEIEGQGTEAFRLAMHDLRVRTSAPAGLVARLFDDGALGVTVRKGAVRLSDARKRFADTMLREGCSARLTKNLDAGLEIHPIGPEGVGRMLAWRDGELAFEDDTLAYAAAEFARYGGPRILIADPILARRTISGWFPARDPATFATAAAAVFDLRAEVHADRIVLAAR
jgi:transmembrane sensor